jgi:hypothetical protein
MSKAPDFSSVQDGLGRAEEIPTVVAKLASSRKKEREAAFVELSDERLVHQGTRWEAALPASALLLEELRKPKHPGRELVLAILAHIAVAHPPSFASEATPESLRMLRADSSLAGQCYRAVQAASADITAQLTSRQPATRVQAAALLALVAPELAREQLDPRAEDDEHTRVAVLLARGLALRLTAGDALGKAPRSPKLARVAHHIAQALANEPVEPAELAPALVSPLAEHVTPYGSLAQLGLSAALKLGSAGLPLLESALEAAAPARKPAVARALLCATFPSCATGGEAPLVSVDALSAAERAVLELIANAATQNSWGPLRLLRAAGLPDWRPCLRRFLGLDPPGPLEARVAWRGHDVEAFVVMDTLARGDASEGEARAALAASLAPEVRADLALLINDHVYGLLRRESWTDERAHAFASSLLADARTWPRVRQQIAEFEHGKTWGAWLMLGAWYRHGVGEGDVGLAPIFQSIIARSRGFFAERVREALAATPAALRDELIAGFPLPDLIELRPTIDGKAVSPALAGWAVLDLAMDRPAAARRAAAAVARWSSDEEGRRRQAHPVEAAVQALQSLWPEAHEAILSALPHATEEGRAVLKQVLSKAPS